MQRATKRSWCSENNLLEQGNACWGGLSAFGPVQSASPSLDCSLAKEYFCAPFGVDQQSCQRDFYFEITTPQVPNHFVSIQ
jgi:hypothetical protein